MELRDPAVMMPRGRGYFTPILWKPAPKHESVPKEWSMLRELFASARAGDFHALDGLVETYPTLQDRAARMFARNLLGDAGTDSQLTRVAAYVREAVTEPDRACELCHSLGLWGRLSAAQDIYIVYERNFGGQYAEGLPAYLTTMLERGFGPVAKHPNDDDDEIFAEYEKTLNSAVHQVASKLGSVHAYALFGEHFSIPKLAEEFLSLLDQTAYSRMMQPFLRQRFEASTGDDCSDFFDGGDAQPLTIKTRLQAWLAGPLSQQFAIGERYFFGNRIPR